MKRNKNKACALIWSVCFLCVTSLSFAQVEINKVKQTSVTPVVTKGYYSIYNNANKLNSSAGRLIIAPGSQQPINQSQRNQLKLPLKGYYSIDTKATRNDAAIDSGINFSTDGNSGVIQTEAFPKIRKGYYSVGNNAQKLRK